MKYLVIATPSLERLVVNVNEKLEQGWGIAGGVSISTYTYDGRDGLEIVTEYAQAMTLKEMGEAVAKPLR